MLKFTSSLPFDTGRITMQSFASIDSQEATELGRHVLGIADHDGLKIAVCVVDARGWELFAARTDGADRGTWKTAHDKAVTAIEFQRDTIELQDGWDMKDAVNAAKINPTFTSWGGGVLIPSLHDGSVLGAIAVSGLSAQEDHVLALRRPSGWSA
jgi:glc operon protein GlcG